MNIKTPECDQEWERLASRLLRSQLALAGMSLTDLSHAMEAMGSRQSVANISAKLKRGRFGAAFMLQALAAAGVDELRLPVRLTASGGDRGGAPS